MTLNNQPLRGHYACILKTFTKKVNLKKQRRFDRSTVIFKLKSKRFACAQTYTIDYKNANETLTKTLKYLHRNNTRKLRHEYVNILEFQSVSH